MVCYQGPHETYKGDGVLSGFDVVPPEIRPCPSPTPKDRFITASASGTIRKVGREDDPRDPFHSIVIVNHGMYETGYMHLANISVQKGQVVKVGDLLGNPSCEVPPGGRATGVHAHTFVLKDGKPVPIDEFSFSGWRADYDEKNARGVFMKEGEVTRIADKGRCGPDEATIKNCGGIRNDITHLAAGMRVFHVDAINKEGVHTKIYVRGGDTLLSEAHGVWCMGGSGADHSIPQGECGNPDGVRPANPVEYPLVLSSAQIGTLIGKAGEKIFKLGKNAIVLIEEDGELILIFNDRPEYYGDNSGRIAVMIAVIPSRKKRILEIAPQKRNLLAA